jgi:hypothetical protein
MSAGDFEDPQVKTRSFRPAPNKRSLMPALRTPWSRHQGGSLDRLEARTSSRR